MRIAIFSDIHGNLTALKAVLNDIRMRGGADACWVLGDIVAFGPSPVEVVDRLFDVPNVWCIQGDTDRLLLTDPLASLPLDTISPYDREWAPHHVIIESLMWTRERLEQGGWLSWLAKLPAEHRTRLPDGTNFVGAHVAPNTLTGTGISPRLDQKTIKQLIADSGAELICTGHTHWPLDIRFGKARIINLGSLSNPRTAELLAHYIMLDVKRSGYTVTHRAVSYNHDAVIETAKRVGYPTADYLISFMVGEQVKQWAQGVR